MAKFVNNTDMQYEIAYNKKRLQTDIDANTSSISTLTTSVNQNAEGISINTSNITSIGNRVTTVENTIAGNVASLVVEYGLSDSVTTAPTTWSTTAPEWEDGKYMWQRTTTTYNDGNTNVTTTCIAGAQGAIGNGVDTIVNHYAVSSSNTTAPTTWYDTMQTMTETERYLWNYQTIVYSSTETEDTTPIVIGVYGDTGSQGEQGETGATGVGISSVRPQYALSTSNETAPDDSDFTYEQPNYEDGYFIWTRSEIVYDDLAGTTVYTTPIVANALTDANAAAAQNASDISSLKTQTANLWVEAGNIRGEVSSVSESVLSESEVQNITTTLYEERVSTLEQTADSLSLNFATKTEVEEAAEWNEYINTEAAEQETYITFDADGISIGKSDANIKSKFDNDSLLFVDQSDEVQAWLSTDEGLGAKELSVGDPETITKRWRIIVSEDGTHMRFTRHQG